MTSFYFNHFFKVLCPNTVILKYWVRMSTYEFRGDIVQLITTFCEKEVQRRIIVRAGNTNLTYLGGH